MRPLNQPRSGTACYALAAVLLPTVSWAFDSGSTGADSVFNPTVNTELQLPESGIFNFVSVNIPAGVTVKFKRNTTNTPVVVLASGDVTIAGIIDISGADSAPVGAAGDGAIGDDGLPGLGGPGGYDGGRGGLVGTTARNGGAGLGPGGGGGGPVGKSNNTDYSFGGGGAGFSVAGAANYAYIGYNWRESNFGNKNNGGKAYGSNILLPLIGGSGGGGGAAGTAFNGSGGGGGGGAILIAATGTVNVTGSILARGGKSGAANGDGGGGTGGAGSGGAIRVISTTIMGNGTVSAVKGEPGTERSYGEGGTGADGFVRFEAETFTRTAASNPPYTFAAPGAVFVQGFPTLRISRVAGVDAPAAPTGNADITLPASTPNPVTVEFATTGVPVGNTVKLIVTPARGDIVETVSGALTGTSDAAAASASINLPSGPSTLSATTTYTIVASLGDDLSRFAEGERVEQIALNATLNGESTVTLITVSGKRHTVPSALLAMGLPG